MYHYSILQINVFLLLHYLYFGNSKVLNQSLLLFHILFPLKLKFFLKLLLHHLFCYFVLIFWHFHNLPSHLQTTEHFRIKLLLLIIIFSFFLLNSSIYLIIFLILPPVLFLKQFYRQHFLLFLPAFLQQQHFPVHFQLLQLLPQLLNLFQFLLLPELLHLLL